MIRKESKYVTKRRKMPLPEVQTDLLIFNKHDPNSWIKKWKSLSLRNNVVILEKRDNGLLFKIEYFDVVFDEEHKDYKNDYPVIAVLATIDRINGDRWVHISYTVKDGQGFPRAPLPREASIVRELFIGQGCQVGAPAGYAQFESDLMKNYWLNIDKR